MIWLLAVVGYAALVAAVVWLLRRQRPLWGEDRVIGIATAPGPLLALLGTVGAIARLGPAPAGEIDATGMAMMVIMVIGGFAMLVMLGVGLAASLLAWRFLR